eukprot:COSAG03_NODE_2260_length_2947_cov_3.757022_1_plen_74_part_00
MCVRVRVCVCVCVCGAHHVGAGVCEVTAGLRLAVGPYESALAAQLFGGAPARTREHVEEELRPTDLTAGPANA